MKQALSRNPILFTPLLLVFGLALIVGGCGQGGEEHESAEADAPVVEEIPITTESDAALALFEEGQYLLDVGRNVAAREKFMAAIEEDPGFVQAHFNQSNASLSFKEFQMCLDMAQENLGSASPGEKMMVEINRSFLTNDPEEGLALATQLVDSYPNSPRAEIVLAGMQANQNDNAAARASLSRAIELDPTSAGALFFMAANHLNGEPKNFTTAEEWVQKAIAAYPDEAKAYELLGDVKRGQNDLPAALEAYYKAVEVDPTLEVGHHKKGHVDSFLGNFEDARDSYDAAIAAAPPESAAGYAVFKGFVNIHAGDIPAAIDELVALADNVEAMGTPADQVMGNQIFAINSAAAAALHAGLYDRAAELIERRNELAMAVAAEVGTEDAARLQEAGTHFWSGRLAARKGDVEGAQMHADAIAALVEGDENPRKMEGAHYVLGMSAMQQGDAAAAVEHLSQADHANNMYIRYQLALAEEANGNTAEAQKLFGEVATFNFNSVGFALARKDAMERSAT